MDPSLSTLSEAARWVALARLRGSLTPSWCGLLLLLVLYQVSKVRHLLLVQLVHIGAGQLPLMVGAA